MKKNNINWIFNNHSSERFFERTALNITKKQIAKAITNNQLVPFKRINTTRSMIYIHVGGQVIKTIMHRKKNKIITILPWNSIYNYVIKLRIFKYQNKTYQINLYPDCFLETKRPNALTKITQLNGKDQYFHQEQHTKIQYNHPLFKEIFGLAWSYFQTDDEHQLINKERKSGCETFEIKGKAKTIESIIDCGNYSETPC